MTDNKRLPGTYLDKPGVKWKKSRWDQGPQWIWEDNGMNPTEKALWLFINRRAGQDRLVYAGQPNLAKGIGCHTSTIKRAIVTMKEKGVLDYKKVGRTNRYTLVVPPQYTKDLMDSYQKDEAPGSSGGKLTGVIDTSLLTVPGGKSLDTLIKAYADAVPTDDQFPFPVTWEEAYEEHGAQSVESLNRVVRYMDGQVREA
jgi:hypothetical protein